MQFYRLHKPMHVGAGQPVSLDPEQVASRRHNLAGEAESQGDRFLCKGKVPLQFKAGEVVGLAELPKYARESAEVLTAEQVRMHSEASTKAREAAAGRLANAKRAARAAAAKAEPKTRAA